MCLFLLVLMEFVESLVYTISSSWLPWQRFSHLFPLVLKVKCEGETVQTCPKVTLVTLNLQLDLF